MTHPLHDLEPSPNPPHELNVVIEMPHFLREVEHFFTIYKDLEGKPTDIQGWADLERALHIVGECVERYQEARR